MKKSIKYAGIAAATLLAVAPVAAPVVSGTTNVQAAATNATTDQSVQTKSVTDYMNQFTSSKAVLASDLVGKTITPTDSTDLTSMNTNNAGLFLSKDANLDADVANINSTKDASVSVTAKSGSMNLTTATDVNNYLKDETKPEVDITVTLTWYDLNTTKQTATKTIKATRATEDTNANELTKLNVAFTTPVSVPLNSTTTDTQLTGTTGMKLTDQNGDGVFAGNVSVSPAYYATYADAMKNAGNASATTSENIVKDNKFVKGGTYYQAVTFTANSSTKLAQFISQYQNEPSKYTVYVNGQVATPGYDFDSTDNTISFVRTVKVSNTTDQWTTTDTTGVVTTKTASNYYTLKNDDNNTIANRALGANTPWRTDKVRTNQDGVKQYRVATGEWIDADNVVYSNGNNNSNNGSGLTDIKTVSGVATLTKAKGYFMALFNDEGKAYDNKYLGSPSAWRVDRTAKGADGNTYYRVATSEWLQAGEGVSFK